MIYTVEDLIKGATSSSSEDRKRAYAVFQTWVKRGPQLSPQQQLGYVERDVLTRLFAEKGFGVVQQPKRRRA